METGSNKLRVFFIEDNIDDMELELHELQKAGYEVTYDSARNRREFMEKLPEISADVILADYSLPDMTGYEAIDILKKAAIDSPVVLVTGDGNESIAVDSLRLGASDYIIKKHISGLSARVARVIEMWADRKAKERAEAEEKRLQQLLIENQRMEAIGRLAGGIAHDFNNLLMGIIGYSELSLNDVGSESEIAGNLKSIIALSGRGADLVKQLLIFSRKMSLEFHVIDLNAFLRGTMQFLARIVEKTVELELITDDLPIFVECDSGQFTQVIMNLILNARDAVKGKGRIVIRTRISDEPGGESQYARLSVTDNGEGIPKENLQKIFEPFFTTKEVGRGTGLGLAIVFTVVKAHRGMIDVRSVPGEGTTFTVSLPLKGQPPHSAMTAPGFLSESEMPEVRGNETVLIAEDEEVIRNLLCSYLRSCGYSVIEATDGNEALVQYTNMAGKVDIVVSDMIMPNMGGIELFRKLLSQDPDVKFILATGYSLSDQDGALLKKMSAICQKPFAPVHIVRQIRAVLK